MAAADAEAPAWSGDSHAGGQPHSAASQLPAAAASGAQLPEAQAPPSQQQIGPALGSGLLSGWLSGPGLGAPAADAAQAASLRPELTSGPHLRASVVAACGALFVAMRLWAPQASLLPFVLLACTSTSALWCLPGELVISLGPVPVCFLRRRIPYAEIASIQEVRGSLRAAGALGRRLLRPWRPLGFAYGLTLGKELIDLELHPAAQSAQGYFLGQPVLISVDEAEEVIAHVLFRQKYGATAPLPASLLARGAAAARGERTVKWVVLDVLDLLLSWHASNTTACNACGLLLAPIQATIEAQRAKLGADGRDHTA